MIAEYTKGNYRLVEKYPNKDVDYEDGTPADVFFFENLTKPIKVILVIFKKDIDSSQFFDKTKKNLWRFL